MGILQTLLPRKNDLSLDKLLLGFLLGEKIHLHWNKCQGMAREFILFVRIYHRIGRETAVSFETSPGLLTGCHRGKMNTSGEWGAGTDPQEATRVWQRDAFLVFLPGTQIGCPLCLPPVRKNPQIQTHVFYGSWIFLWVLAHVLDKCTFQHRRGTAKGKKHFGDYKATSLSITMGLASAGKTWLFVASTEELPHRYVGQRWTAPQLLRDPDSSFTSSSTRVTFGKPGNCSGPHFPHL